MSRATPRGSSPQTVSENGVSSVGSKKASTSASAVAGVSAIATAKAVKRRTSKPTPGTTVSADGSSVVATPRRTQASPRGSAPSATPRSEKSAPTKQPGVSTRPNSVQKPVGSSVAQAKAFSGEGAGSTAKRVVSRTKATGQPKTAPSDPEVPEPISAPTLKQVQDVATDAVAAAVAAATSAARRVYAPELSAAVGIKADVVASSKIALDASLNETLPSSVTAAISETRVSTDSVEEEMLTPQALIADVGGTTGLSGEGQSGGIPDKIVQTQNAVSAVCPMSPEDLKPAVSNIPEEVLASVKATVDCAQEADYSAAALLEASSTFQQPPVNTPRKRPEEEKTEKEVGMDTAIVDILPAASRAEKSILGQVTVEALCAENQRLREEVERQRVQIEMLAGSGKSPDAVATDSGEGDVVVKSLELEAAVAREVAPPAPESAARAPKAVVLISPPAGYGMLAAPASTALTPGVPAPVNTGAVSPVVPMFAGSVCGKAGVPVQMGGSAMTPRVLAASPRLGAGNRTGTNSVPVPSCAMPVRFVTGDSARAPVCTASPLVAMRSAPQAKVLGVPSLGTESPRAPPPMCGFAEASGMHTPRYLERSVSPVNRVSYNGHLQHVLPVQAGYFCPDYDMKASPRPSPLWPAEVGQISGRAVSSATTPRAVSSTTTPVATAPSQLPRWNATAYRMVPNEGIVYQYAASPLKVVQPQSERREISRQQVGLMRGEYERMISPAAQARSPQVERRVEGVSCIASANAAALL
mmetsp:Transcript_24173/g.37919  ORF Transcript_24173/g.37919 Transcript_24173/m.37919 type:complete len:757 (-) Transcript_24173:77-2347(-)